MKLSKKTKTSTKGFTLIELLVVIAVLASLATLSYGPIMNHLNTAANTKEKKVCKDIVFAITTFEQEYDSLPYTGSTYPTSDAGAHTWTADLILEVLVGENTDINDRGKNFFKAKDAQDGKGGMVYNTDGTVKQLLDKWGKPYHIRLDYNADGVIDASQIGSPWRPTAPFATELHVENAIAGSRGKDGSFDENDPTSF